MKIVQFEDRDARDKKAPCRESSSLLKTPSERKHGEGGTKRNTYRGSVGVGEEEKIPYVTLVDCGRRKIFFGSCVSTCIKMIGETWWKKLAKSAEFSPKNETFLLKKGAIRNIFWGEGESGNYVLILESDFCPDPSRNNVRIFSLSKDLSNFSHICAHKLGFLSALRCCPLLNGHRPKRDGGGR